MLKRTREKNSYEKNQVYGRLTLTGLSYLKSMYGQRRRIVEADCECGSGTRYYLFESLTKGDTKSCGCLARELSSERFRSHGLSEHPLFIIWAAFRQRCNNPENKSYHDYGGRGISVCTEWDQDFKSFYNWAIAHGWEKGKDLDRENNDGKYEPNNCRFLTRPESNRNTRRNIIIEAWGEKKCLFDWANDSRCLISKWALRSRYERGGWSTMEEMISSPKIEKKDSQQNMKSNRMLKAFGEEKCFTEWLRDERCVVKIDSFRDRLDKGMTVELALTKPPRK